MIDLGSMAIADRESISAAREKVLVLVRALGASEVAATRAATGVSEVARQCLTARGRGDIAVAVATDGPDVRLHLRVGAGAGGRPDDRQGLDPARLAAFFDRVTPARDAGGAALVAELLVGAGAGLVTPEFVSRARARIASKSRTELLEELQVKNRQLEEYNARLEATVAERTSELRLANEQMRRDLEAGAAYVRALIPPPLDGPVRVDWRYVPSSSLGGDTIGYHWLDDEHLVFYLIDVTGHGLDSALLAVTATNMIRSGTLPSVDMRRPDQVIAALNEAFQSDRHGNKFFTIWYGVFDVRSRRLRWSGGGHHPAVLQAPGASGPALLESTGVIVGCATGMEYPAESCAVAPGSRLLIFSDGVFEILREGQVVWSLEGAIDFLSAQAARGEWVMDALLTHVHGLRGSTRLDDDFSIIEAFFP